MWIMLGITHPVVSVLGDPPIYPHLWIKCGQVWVSPSWSESAPVDEIALTVDEQPMFFPCPQTSGRHPRVHPQPIPKATTRVHERIFSCTQNPHSR